MSDLSLSPEISFENIIYKRQGSLESEGAEALPPTRITEEAQKRLEKWGLTRFEIEALRGFTSQFRYDLCEEKVARLSQTPAEVFTRKGQDYVNLPAFFDISGRLDGQCGDIGRQWIIKMNESGLIRKLNDGKSNQIVSAFYTGQSETHFCEDGSNHVWNGLVLADEDGEIIDEIYFDAAFQTIHSKSETRYRQKTAVYKAKTIESEENTEVQVGWVEIDGHSWKGNVPTAAVIGVSSDYQFGYALGFLRDRNTNEIRPVLNRISKDGSNSYFILGNDGQVLKSRGSIHDNDDEIGAILKEAAGIVYIEKPPTKNKIVWKRKDVYG